MVSTILLLRPVCVVSPLSPMRATVAMLAPVRCLLTLRPRTPMRTTARSSAKQTKTGTQRLHGWHRRAKVHHRRRRSRPILGRLT